MTQTIFDRFTRETAEHVMTVVHDDGLYRHLRFRRTFWRPPLVHQQTSGLGWFDLITVPGSLIFQGDGDSFHFRRVPDMFDFFRGPVGRINPSYWAEKLVTPGRQDSVMKYDREIFEDTVKREFVAAVRERRAPAGLGLAVRRELLDPVEESWTDEGAHRLVREFAFWADETARTGHSKYVNGRLTWVEAQPPEFEFADTWEWSFKDYDWWFLWALHAIVWGIAQYDSAARAEGRPDACRPQDVGTLQPVGGVL